MIDVMKPKFLRVMQEGYENYTGVIGVYDFVDGVSVQKIGLAARDRLAAAFAMVEFDEGEEPIPAGPAHRLATMSHVALGVVEPSERQTDEEKAEEERLAAKLAAETAFNPAIYDFEQLQKIADKGGIKALREIAEPWNVKSRQIGDLIQLILDAQKDWVEKRGATSEARIEQIEEIQASVPTEEVSSSDKEDEDDFDTPDPVEIPSPGSDDDIEAAAISGDMGAALKQDA